LKIGLGGTRLVCREETERGAWIELGGIQPMRREETDVGGKLGGRVQKRNKQRGKFEGSWINMRWIGEESSERCRAIRLWEFDPCAERRWEGEGVGGFWVGTEWETDH
jgi:hypothetical protein